MAFGHERDLVRRRRARYLGVLLGAGVVLVWWLRGRR
jgi:hypothetical protein